MKYFTAILFCLISITSLKAGDISEIFNYPKDQRKKEEFSHPHNLLVSLRFRHIGRQLTNDEKRALYKFVIKCQKRTLENFGPGPMITSHCDVVKQMIEDSPELTTKFVESSEHLFPQDLVATAKKLLKKIGDS